ncbi:hypothetical protein GDO86_001621, partial [Hymenochirus boettgeri]
LILPCNHTSITPTGYIHWYKLPPDQGPMLVIIGFKDMETDMFSMTFSKDRKSSYLHKKNIKLEDSGIYLCALSDTVINTHQLTVQYVTT